MKILGLLLLHVICLYFLRLLWKDKNESIKRGGALTKMGYVSKKQRKHIHDARIPGSFETPSHPNHAVFAQASLIGSLKS